MDKIMLEIKVSTTTEGQINIEQGWESREPEVHQIIEIAPSQVEILTQWLQEAKAELEK